MGAKAFFAWYLDFQTTDSYLKFKTRMPIRDDHLLNVTPKQAIEIQKSLGKLVRFKKLIKPEYVAGTDISFSKKTDRVWAGVVVLSYPDLIKKEEKWVDGESHFPYIPGLLSFREIPVLLKAIRLLEIQPDLFFCDGQGIAHPRGLGLASHLGLILNKPTVGCAKSRLVGDYLPVGTEKGNYEYLRYGDRIMGAVLRTRANVKPLFISQGHKITLVDCINIVLQCCPRYRVPEPVRQAHHLVERLRKSQEID